MNPIATALVAGTLIIVGKWSINQSPNIDNAIGVAGIAVGLAVLEQANVKLSRAFGALILLSVTIVYFPKIAKAVDLKGTK